MKRALVVLLLGACWNPEEDLARCVDAGRCEPPDGGAAGGAAGGTAGGGAAGGNAGGSAGGTAGGGAAGGAPFIDDGGTCFINGTWSWPCVDAELALSEAAGFSAANPVLEQWPALDAGTSSARWAGAVLTPQGEVACLPYDASSVLFIKPDGSMRLGPARSSAFRYTGGVLGNDGNIYAVPYTQFPAPLLRIDPVTGATSDINIPSSPAAGGHARFCGAVGDTRGRLWIIPYGSDWVTHFDPDAGTSLQLYVMDAGTPMNNYCAGVLWPDGRIFAMPQTRQEFLELVPDDGGFQRIPIAQSGARAYSAVLSRNGKAYGVPQGFLNILEVLPSGGSSVIGLNTGHYNGGARSPDGRIVYVPEGTNDVAVYDPATGNKAFAVTGQTGTLRWSGGVTGIDGRVYACPYNSDRVLVIDTNANRRLPLRALLSPWFNKL